MAKTYTAPTTADRHLHRGRRDAVVADPSATAPGHLVNGTFSLPAALKASATSPAGTAAAGGAVSRLAADAAHVLRPGQQRRGRDHASRRTSAPTDALRTGSYSKTLTFTLSTTTP